MARFTSFVAADTVGSPTQTVPTPVDAFDAGPANLVIEYSSNYVVIVSGGGNATYITDRSKAPFLDPFSNKINSVWEASPGDNLSSGELTTKMLLPGNSTQNVQQFLFSKDDKIRGSDFDDKLCGWAGRDKLWGFDGRDAFYYGKGMGKDTICDFDTKKDEIVLDDSIAKNFKKLKRVKYNEKRTSLRSKAARATN